jgi:hypothetical protein
VSKELGAFALLHSQRTIGPLVPRNHTRAFKGGSRQHLGTGFGAYVEGPTFGVEEDPLVQPEEVAIVDIVDPHVAPVSELVQVIDSITLLVIWGVRNNLHPAARLGIAREGDIDPQPVAFARTNFFAKDDRLSDVSPRVTVHDEISHTIPCLRGHRVNCAGDLLGRRPRARRQDQ